MGYTTEFYGTFNLNKKLAKTDHMFLDKFNETRRMARRVGPEYGEEGEFYVAGKGFAGQDEDSTIIDHNRPPRTQPGLWCQWKPSKDGKSIVWDGQEKFYKYVEWLEYLIEKILKPRGYILNGEVEWSGEEADDRGVIVVKDNLVETATTEEKLASLEKILEQKTLLPQLMGLTPYLDKQIARRLK